MLGYHDAFTLNLVQLQKKRQYVTLKGRGKKKLRTGDAFFSLAQASIKQKIVDMVSMGYRQYHVVFQAIKDNQPFLPLKIFHFQQCHH